MTYRRITLATTPDGKTFPGATALDVVCRMLEAGLFTAGKTPDEYMRGVSARARHLSGAVVRHDTPEHFLADMEAAGELSLSLGD